MLYYRSCDHIKNFLQNMKQHHNNRNQRKSKDHCRYGEHHFLIAVMPARYIMLALLCHTGDRTQNPR